MKNYESPVIYDNEELAEGVYATGSGGGDTDCWEYNITQIPGETQTNNNGWNKTGFEVEGKHRKVEHISLWTTTTYSLIPGDPEDKVNYVECAGVKVYPGNTAENNEDVYDAEGHYLGKRFILTLDNTGTTFTLQRTCHANAYAEGDYTDQFTVNVIIYSDKGTMSLQMLGIPYCEHHVNAHGIVD